jgi:hypothetical protein
MFTIFSTGFSPTSNISGKITKQISTKECGIYGAKTTWDFFLDAVKEQYYSVDNYEDQYMRWTSLRKEKIQTVSEFTNTFHTLCTKLGIKYFEWHLVLKYRGALHRYIQTEWIS